MMNKLRYLFQLVAGKIPGKGKNPYQAGISVLVCCKDEGYNITLCLNSLLPFADQIICVDNGSGDETLEKMKSFKTENPDKDIIVLEAPEKTLRDARQAGLEHVNRRWLLHIGGDFVFYTSGTHRFIDQLAEMTKHNRYAAWRLSFINLYGDLHHTYKVLDIQHVGEHYLMRMHPAVSFKESGKFDFLHFPRFYLRHVRYSPSFFHMDGMKSDERLIYRNAYFEWRWMVNTYQEDKEGKLKNFNAFFTLWKKHLFGTTDPKKLKFRFQRQLAEIYYRPYDPVHYHEYPELIKDLMSSGKERFEVIYKDGRPFTRRDHEDEEMKGFIPGEDDLRWNIDDYNAKYHAKDYLREIKEELMQNASSD